jgi:hypothetical protein
MILAESLSDRPEFIIIMPFNETPLHLRSYRKLNIIPQ